MPDGTKRSDTQAFDLDAKRVDMLGALNAFLRGNEAGPDTKRGEVMATISAVRQIAALAGISDV